MTVVVVGSVNRDYVCRVPTIPTRGQTLLGEDVVIGSGGKGGNQAVAAAAAGARTFFVGRVGADADGDALRADLDAAGVDTTALAATAAAETGRAFVLVAADGENAIVVSPGANTTLTAGEVEAALQHVADSSTVVVTQGEVPPDVIDACLRAADAAGARPVLNLAPFVSLPDDVLARCDPLVVNESEASALLGHPVAGVGGALAAAAALATRCRSAVVTIGEAGAVYADADTATHVPADPVTAVDTTGAGDVFTGFLAASLAGGADLGAAVRRGTRAATFAVQQPGARPSFEALTD